MSLFRVCHIALHRGRLSFYASLFWFPRRSACCSVLTKRFDTTDKMVSVISRHYTH